jgi:hypothetical protein
MNVWQRLFGFFVSHLELFARTFGKAGALAYFGELVVHVMVFTTSFRLAELPFWADWAMVLLGGYCMIFMWVFRSATVVRFGDPEVRVLTTFFVTATVFIHIYMIVVHSHALLEGFGRSFSYFGVLYSVFLVLRLGTLKTRVTVGRPHAPRAVVAAFP